MAGPMPGYASSSLTEMPERNRLKVSPATDCASASRRSTERLSSLVSAEACRFAAWYARSTASRQRFSGDRQYGRQRIIAVAMMAMATMTSSSQTQIMGSPSYVTGPRFQSGHAPTSTGAGQGFDSPLSVFAEANRMKPCRSLDGALSPAITAHAEQRGCA